MTSNESKSSADIETRLQTILFVEDDEEIADFIADVLKEERPAAVLRVTDAAHALAALTSIKPSLFLLDYLLPGINGLELSDRLHAIEGFETVPTLMISASLPPKKELQQRHITFLGKPFDLADLLTAIDTLLHEPEE